MKISIIAFTPSGMALGYTIKQQLDRLGHECTAYTTFAEPLGGIIKVDGSLSQWSKREMEGSDALIFVGACGIAVRSIAPYIKSKAQDPAVVVVDELGKFAISLLSGHIGGANELAAQIGELIGAVPVITTATDLGGKFSVDSWAAKNNLSILNLPAAKKVAMALLENQPVGLCTHYEVSSPLPCGVNLADSGKVGIYIGLDWNIKPFETTLHLAPKTAVFGIGCKKGSSAQSIELAVQKALAEASIPFEAVAKACSIDLKADETGLLNFCKQHSLPFEVFSASALKEAVGSFSSSDFVEGVTGVDNVCERSAVLGSKGKILLKKQCLNGVTVAIAEAPYTIHF